MKQTDQLPYTSGVEVPSSNAMKAKLPGSMGGPMSQHQHQHLMQVVQAQQQMAN